MILSERLSSVLRMVTPGKVVADIGCDHGYLSISLIDEDIAPKVIAMDINKGPLNKAKENIEAAGYEDRIETRLSNGLDKLEIGEVDSVVIAGMGGPLMADIIRRGISICDEVSELILEPQSDIESLRHFLEDNKYRIISEDMVYEDGKFYPIMKAIHGNMSLEEDIFYKYGKILLHEEHPVLRQYLRYERKVLSEIRDSLLLAKQTEKVEKRLEELNNEIRINEQAIRFSDRIDPIAVDRVLK